MTPTATAGGSCWGKLAIFSPLRCCLSSALLCIQIGMIMVIPHEPPNIDFHNPNSFAGMLLILFYASLGMVGVSLIIQACLYALPSKPEGARFD